MLNPSSIVTDLGWLYCVILTWRKCRHYSRRWRAGATAIVLLGIFIGIQIRNWPEVGEQTTVVVLLWWDDLWPRIRKLAAGVRDRERLLIERMSRNIGLRPALDPT